MSKAKIAGLGLVILALFLFGFNFASILKLAPEDKINSAIPVSDAVLTAEKNVIKQASGSKRSELEEQLANRLKLRALSCAKGYSPSWLTSREEVRENLDDHSCFIDADKEIARWLGIIRAGLVLAEPPLRPIPAKSPEYIVADGSILNARFAEKAGVALIETSQAVEVIDFEGNKPIFKETRESSMLGSLSPNGRLFTVNEGNRLKIRESESGNVIAEIPAVRANQFFWIDERTGFYSSSNSGQVFLVDFLSGKEIQVDAVNRGTQFVAKVPGNENRFVLFSYNSVTKIELVRTRTEPDVRLVDDKQLKSVYWSGNVFNLTTDGGKAFSFSSAGLTFVSLDSLEVETIAFEPFYIRFASATPDPNKLLLAGFTRTLMGQREKYFLFSISNQILMPINAPANQSRFVYMPSIRKQASISESKIATMAEMPTQGAIPLSQFVSDALQEVNQSKLDAFDRQQAQGVIQGQNGYGSYSSQALTLGAPALVQVPAPAAPPASFSAGYERPGGGVIAQLARNAQIESVGVYQGPRSGSLTADGRHMGAVEVNIRRSSKPIVLVLSAYEPVQWKLKLAPGAQLRTVLVSGYYPSQVTGAGGARTVIIGRDYAYKLGSAEYNRLNQQVMMWTGRTIDVFQGLYEGSSFSAGG
ncbi:MAG: hypothetical protein Q8K12_00310 [Thiobacillus sp.]|nr:hypothetical protein [Thiobacillus sp.]